MPSRNILSFGFAMEWRGRCDICGHSDSRIYETYKFAVPRPPIHIRMSDARVHISIPSMTRRYAWLSLLVWLIAVLPIIQIVIRAPVGIDRIADLLGRRLPVGGLEQPLVTQCIQAAIFVPVDIPTERPLGHAEKPARFLLRQSTFGPTVIRSLKSSHPGLL